MDEKQKKQLDNLAYALNLSLSGASTQKAIDSAFNDPLVNKVAKQTAELFNKKMSLELFLEANEIMKSYISNDELRRYVLKKVGINID